ncbi:MAG: M48 family metallopeptidase [Undibacterium umbellatum]|uniref:M48 family metallopeptidase n=1 Tax=Undibacterium umbellatum TaxID=2762300 RepID=UPI003BB688DE
MDLASSKYACHAFHASLPGGRDVGELSLSQSGLSYHVASLLGTLSFAHMELTMGGSNNTLVFIKHAHKPDLVLYTSDLSILKNPALLAHPECSRQIAALSRKRMLGWGLLVGFSLLLLALPAGLIWQMDGLSAYVAKQVPVEWEEKLGASVAAQDDLKNKRMPKAEADAVLKPLTAPLLQALPDSPYRYSINIVNDSTTNAYALPGGYVAIHSGLILKAGSAEELLGVLAHEISHVEERHGTRSIIGNAGIYLVASAVFGDVSGLLAVFGNAAPMLLSQQYSRRFETDADEKGVLLLIRARINPAGLPVFFERMIAEEKAALEKIDNKQAREAYKQAMGLLSTHPASDKRMAHLRTLIVKSQGPYINQDAAFKDLQEAVKKFVAKSTTNEIKKPAPATPSPAPAPATQS